MGLPLYGNSLNRGTFRLHSPFNIPGCCVPLPSRSHSTPSKTSCPQRSRLSRTLSDTPSATDSNTDPETDSPHTPPLTLDSPLLPALNSGAKQSPARTTVDDSPLFHASLRSPGISPFPNRKGPRSGGDEEEEEEEEEDDDGALETSRYYSFHSHGGNSSQGEASPLVEAPAIKSDRSPGQEGSPGCSAASRGSVDSHGSGGGAAGSPTVGDKDRTVVPMTLYQHRVKGLVLALLVEPHCQRDTEEAMEEVVCTHVNFIPPFEEYCLN